MNDLIFSFNENQMNEYLKLKEENTIPDLSRLFKEIVFPKWEQTSFDEIINMISHMTEISLFSKKLDKEEWKNKLTEFYSAAEHINSLILNIKSNSASLIQTLNEFEKIHFDITKKYNAFLPCLAAFGDNDEVKKADAHLRASLSQIENKSLALSDHILSLNKITDTVIPEFFKNAERIIIDRENFSQAELNFACNSAVEKIKTIISK